MNSRIRSYLFEMARANDSMRRADKLATGGFPNDVAWDWYDDVRGHIDTAKAMLRPDDDEPCKPEREMLETRARLMMEVFAPEETTT